MKRVLVVFLASFLGFSVFLAMPAFGGGVGGLGDRFSGEVTDEGIAAEGVAGNSFFGSFTNSCGFQATSCMSFDLDGNIAWDQDFGSGPFVFFGTYGEFAFGPFSLWSATLADGSPNGEFSLAGLTVFSNFTLMLLRNTDESCPDGTPLTARGRYRRSICTPGQRLGATGSDFGIGGTR